MSISAPAVILIVFVVILVLILIKTVKIVPHMSVYIVERLGKYHANLNPGLHLIIPFVDRVAYKHTLKEQSIDVASQTCITKDNISVEVDGVLYLQVMDPQKASYGIDDYHYASIQLAQTTNRSIIGQLDLDKTFEERESINGRILNALDKASDPWGVKVTRYEVKNITPPQTVHDAMEKHMRSEREKRAEIAESEGNRQAQINRAEGEKQELIARSEGEKQKRINEAEGHAAEIERIAQASSKGISEVAKAVQEEGGRDAVNLRVAEQYIEEFGKLAKENNTMIVPADLSDISKLVSTAMSVVQHDKKTGPGEADPDEGTDDPSTGSRPLQG